MLSSTDWISKHPQDLSQEFLASPIATLHLQPILTETKCSICSTGAMSTTSVIGPFDSDISANASHSWSKSGTYQVKAKAIDADIPGITSRYSDPLTVTIRG